MSLHFTYCLLQYKHSPVLKEAINIGIVFLFPNEKISKDSLHFAHGNAFRAKSIYPDFDNYLVNEFLKVIEKKVINSTDIFQEKRLELGLSEFLHQYILAEDDSALQFSEPEVVTNTFKSRDEAVAAFGQLLLPGINIHKPVIKRIDDKLIVRRYRNYLIEKDPKAGEKIIKKPKIVGADTKSQFDFAWENGSFNYLKPLSFDYKEALDIENKAFQNAGLLEYLLPYVNPDKVRFDFIIARPKQESLMNTYEKAIKIIESAKAPVRFIQQEQLEEYSQETIDALREH